MRYAIIDMLDCIVYESDNLEELYDVYYTLFNHCSRGIYDYQQNCYLDIVDIIDIFGCQLHSP